MDPISASVTIQVEVVRRPKSGARTLRLLLHRGKVTLRIKGGTQAVEPANPRR